MASNPTQKNIEKTERRELLSGHSLSDVFNNLIEEVSPLLEPFGHHLPEQVANLASRVARYSWKTAVGILENSHHIIDRVGFDGLEKISLLSIRVARHCWTTAVGMIDNSPGLIDKLLKYGDQKLVMRVFDLSIDISQYSWKTAVRMLESSPAIIDRIGFDGLEKISGIGIRIAPHCWLTAVSNFEKSPVLIDKLLEYGNEDLVMKVYGVAGRTSRHSWQMTVCLLENSPDLIDRIGSDGLEMIADFGCKIARHSWLSAVDMLEKSPHLIDRMLIYGDPCLVMNVYGLCSQMADQCWRTAIHLLDKSPDLIDRVGYDGFEKIADRASELNRLNHERAISFINGESFESSVFIDAITDGLELSKVKPILANYLNALLNYRIEIAESSGHSTDGRRIYLPGKICDFEDKQKNFTIYKVFATHEEAHLEYGSFDFSLSKIQDVVDHIKATYGDEK